MNVQVDKSDDKGPRQWENYTDLPVGEILRRTRVYYNLSLPEVERHLRIRASYLGAIEDGRHDMLPGRAYAIGFVRAYAEYLGLDGDKMIHLFKVQSIGGRVKPELNFPVPASESKSPNLYILAGALAALGVVLVVFSLLGGPGTVDRDIPEPQKPDLANAPDSFLEQDPLEAAMTAAITKVTGGKPELMVKPEARVVITALDSAWIEVRNADGKALISRILKKGDRYLVPDEIGLVLDTGNSGVLELMVDGKAIPPLGQVGDVKRRISLSPEALKMALPKAVADEVPPDSDVEFSDE